MTFVALESEPFCPPANTPLVEEEKEPKSLVAVIKFPKSVPLPVEAMVMYSIISQYVSDEFAPPPKIPLVLFEKPLSPLYLSVVKSPKSVALPVEAMVT